MKEGEDAELSRLWDLANNDIARQALVGTPGESTGLIHLVEFNNPNPPVRQGAQVFDECPKNLDIYVHDMPTRHPELLAAGKTFRTETYSEVTAPNGITFREIHMPSHDDINVVLLEIPGEELPFTQKGFAGVGPLITIVADAATEQAFFRDVMGLAILSNNILDGPEIEKMIGLPPGAALDVSIWGEEGAPLGQVEIIDYRGVQGTSLYPRARPKSLGILHIKYAVRDLSQLQGLLEVNELSWVPHGQVETVLGVAETISFITPAGLRIEAYEMNE